MENYKVGDTYYLYGRTRCTIEAETLKPGGVNIDEAMVQIRTVQGSVLCILYKTAHNYLRKDALKFYEKLKPSPIVSGPAKV